MTTKPKQIAEPIKAPALFPECAEYRLALSDQIEMAYLDNHRPSPHPPLVLLHGIFDNKATWFRLATQLAGYRLIAPDLVGHGFSSKPTFGAQLAHQRYAPDMQAETLNEFITALKLDEMILVGNSLGGSLALRLYLRFPELAKKMRGLVLLALRLALLDDLLHVARADVDELGEVGGTPRYGHVLEQHGRRVVAVNFSMVGHT